MSMATPIEFPSSEMLDRPHDILAPKPTVPASSPDLRRVLTPLDGSRLAEKVIPPLLDITRARDLSLVLLRVVPAFPPGMPEGSVQAIEASASRLRDEAAAYLRGVAARLHNVQVEIKVRSSPVPTEILEEARDSGADLIAMTTHGQSGASRLLFGSVTKAVLRDTTVPVFLKSVRHVSASRAAA